jgi:hypothetical protein
MSRPATRAARALARAAHVRRPTIRWRIAPGPSFENQIATVTVQARNAELRIDKAVPNQGDPTLQTVLQHQLA